MGMSADQLTPLVWELWDDRNHLDTFSWPSQLESHDPFLGGTSFDGLFGWGEEYGVTAWPPVFPKLPGDFNTIVNGTTGAQWGRTAIYVLGKGGDVDAVGSATENNYALCQLQVGLTPYCSTQYNASSSAATLEAVCDPDDDVRFIDSVSNAPSGRAALSWDWPSIAQTWASAMELNGGFLNLNTSNSRLLTQLILTNASVDWSRKSQTPQGTEAPAPALSLALPSPAEALAVMAGGMLR